MTAVVEEKIESVVKKSLKETTPKFDEIVPVDVLYTQGGRWHTIEMTWKEYLATLQNGSIQDGTLTKQITAICVNEVNVALEDGSTEKIRMIYDFTLKHTERDPWRMS